MSRKFEAIDLMKLYTHGSYKGWNEELTNLFAKRDINGLMKLRYRICAGMDDVAKAHLNDDRMNAWFARLIRSIEQTAKKIIAVKHPMPGDQKAAAEFQTARYLEAKRKRDLEFREFMKKSAY